MLTPGDIVEVHGWCMLNKLDPGKYRISKIEFIHGKAVYCFTKPKGSKIVIRHYADHVEPWVKQHNDPNLNKIVKIA